MEISHDVVQQLVPDIIHRDNVRNQKLRQIYDNCEA